MMRISGTMLAAVIVVATGAAPATAQLACPPPTPGPTPPPARAGITCTPLAGGGVYNQFTCTLFGDIEWAIANSNGAIPPGTCTVRFTLEGTDWILCPYAQLIGADVLATYLLLGFTAEPEVEFFGCNIPVANSSGLVALSVLLLACGVFVLWRRTG